MFCDQPQHADAQPRQQVIHQITGINLLVQELPSNSNELQGFIDFLKVLSLGIKSCNSEPNSVYEHVHHLNGLLKRELFCFS